MVETRTSLSLQVKIYKSSEENQESESHFWPRFPSLSASPRQPSEENKAATPPPGLLGLARGLVA